MFTCYRIVWVSANSPDIIEGIVADDIECPEEAREELMQANNLVDTDGIDWFPRLQQVTYEFI